MYINKYILILNAQNILFIEMWGQNFMEYFCHSGICDIPLFLDGKLTYFFSNIKKKSTIHSLNGLIYRLLKSRKDLKFLSTKVLVKATSLKGFFGGWSGVYLVSHSKIKFYLYLNITYLLNMDAHIGNKENNACEIKIMTLKLQKLS